MISQPPIHVVHPPQEVWSRQITVRPFVVKHAMGRNAEETLQRVRSISERSRKP